MIEPVFKDEGRGAGQTRTLRYERAPGQQFAVDRRTITVSGDPADPVIKLHAYSRRPATHRYQPNQVGRWDPLPLRFTDHADGAAAHAQWFVNSYVRDYTRSGYVLVSDQISPAPGTQGDSPVITVGLTSDDVDLLFDVVKDVGAADAARAADQALPEASRQRARDRTIALGKLLEQIHHARQATIVIAGVVLDSYLDAEHNELTAMIQTTDGSLQLAKVVTFQPGDQDEAWVDFLQYVGAMKAENQDEQA